MSDLASHDHPKPDRHTESYGAFAFAYDQALGSHFFRALRRLLTELLAKYPALETTHLDVACGTGLAVEFFTDRGFQSMGVDVSLPMLAVARKRAARLVAGDFRSLPLRRTFHRITCLYDSLNHLLDPEDLVATFRAIRALMTPQSLFFFDMNHPDIYREIWGMKEPYISTGADHHLEIATKYRSRDRKAEGMVTGWANIDGVRVPIKEHHLQRAYSERQIIDALGAAGLEPVEVIDFDPFNEREALEAEGVKLFFVVRTTR